MSTHKVFVYGTLREDNSEATHKLYDYAMHLVTGSKFQFPFIVKSSGYLDPVKGNILQVDDEGLAKLDEYEGVATGLYLRVKELVIDISDNSNIEVWVYVAGPRLVYPIIRSGDWLNR